MRTGGGSQALHGGEGRSRRAAIQIVFTSDHRIGLTIHRLHEILDGDLEEIVAGLVAHNQAEKLKASTAA